MVNSNMWRSNREDARETRNTAVLYRRVFTSYKANVGPRWIENDKEVF